MLLRKHSAVSFSYKKNPGIGTADGENSHSQVVGILKKAFHETNSALLGSEINT